MLREIDPKALDGNVFSRIGDQWMLVTAGERDHLNTMTASWGGLGVLWNKPVATVYIRPQRYTLEFVEQSEYFTLSFLENAYRPQLNLCGSKSGREVDKIKECDFTVETGTGGAPYVAEAELVLVCRKLYRQSMKPECFVDQALVEKNYPNQDYHIMFVGEIVTALRK